MYTRSYKQIIPEEKTQTAEECAHEQTAKEESIEKRAKKSRYKARKEMPEFHAPSEKAEEYQSSREAEKCEILPSKPLFSEGELLVLALGVFLLLEGSDDLLVLSLGYILCP